MGIQITREATYLENVAVATAVGNSTEIPYAEFAAGSILIPATATTTTLTWHGAERAASYPSGGAALPANTVSGLTQNFLPAQDSTGAAVTQTVAAGKAYPIPVALLAYAAIKAVGDAATSAIVCLKG